MDNNNKRPLTEKQMRKKVLRRGTRYRAPKVNVGLVIALAFLLVIIAVCVVVIVSRGGNGDTANDSAGSSYATSDIDASGVYTTESADVDDPGGNNVVIENSEMKYIYMSHDEVHRGDLILVNSDHAYVFPDPATDVSVYNNKTKSYQVADLSINLSMDAITPLNVLMDDFYEVSQCRDVMVNSGFRSEQFQRDLYNERVETQGAEMAAKYVALPGHSEHHTGLAMDLTVYNAVTGEGNKLVEYEPCKWLVENFENYGFVLRYPEDKVSHTGISYEPWHYRYVGAPHSLIMKARNLCLEEYIEYLRGLEEGTAVAWNGLEVHEISLDGILDGGYVVYYVPAAESGNTDIAVPQGREYTVSGDNVGGFIVTLMPIDGGESND